MLKEKRLDFSDSEYLDPDEKAFEVLNNAPPRMYDTMPHHLHIRNNQMEPASSYETVNMNNTMNTTLPVSFSAFLSFFLTLPLIEHALMAKKIQQLRLSQICLSLFSALHANCLCQHLHKLN